MTTLDPGASVVFTHGLRARPRSTALLASSAAPIITCGFDVLVQDVIDAITTAPWSSSNVVPSASVHRGRLVRPASLAREFDEGGSEAGKLSSTLLVDAVVAGT